MEPELARRRRCLPHWTLEGSVYYITFNLRQGSLNAAEISYLLNHIKSGDPLLYQLYCAVVMINHAHLMIQPKPSVSLPKIMQKIKGASSRRINQMRGTEGSLWQDEYMDRIIRSDAEMLEKLNYMVNNPVRAGIVEDGWLYHGFYCMETEATLAG